MSGLLFVVSGPSGVGKSTVCTRLREEFPELALSVSYTTRAPRGAEVDGVDYHFVDKQKFQAMVRDGKFVEWAEVHGNFYGTAYSEVEGQLKAGRSVLFDIDYQGAASLRQVFREAVTLMLLPPSMEELERRLRGRNTDPEEVIAERLLNARVEIGHVGAFDYVVLNEDLERTYDEIRSIFVASRCLRTMQRAMIRARFGVGVD